MAFICHIHQISNVTRFVTDIIECILNHAISLWGKLFTAYWALYCIRLRPETYCVEGNIFHYICEFWKLSSFYVEESLLLDDVATVDQESIYLHTASNCRRSDA